MTVDPDKLKQYSFLLFSKLDGASRRAWCIWAITRSLRGDARAGAPLTSTELAEATGLHERWVREWAYNQAAAKLIDVDDEERFSLSPEAEAVLASPDHPAFGMGMFHRLPGDDGRARPGARELRDRSRSRLRQPWTGGRGRDRAQLRAVEQRVPVAHRVAGPPRASSTASSGESSLSTSAAVPEARVC
jgi:hypothetical protein